MNTTQTDHLARNQIPEVEIFEKLNSYPFQSDPEFAKGLSIILGHPDLPATRDEINREDDLVLQAKCFYFSRWVALTMSPGWHGLSGVNESA